MKTIYLIRHAKSSWKNSDQTDFERPLNSRGKKDRITMGKRLKKENCSPQIFLSSAAKRTIETSLVIAKEIDFEQNNIIFKQELYHASSQEIFRIINEQDNSFETLLLVGHNPGISDLSYYLSNIPHSFPTCGVAKITFETNNWQEVFGETGTLVFFDYPKNA